MNPIAIDLFCGAGGAGMGLSRAGFDVVGVDIKPQPNYPFHFIQADVFDLPIDLSLYDFIWASPMCQRYTPLNAYNKKDYPDQIEPVRKMLMATGKPYVIENVVQAPLINPITLCGTMFGLRVYRHRNFETSFPITAPDHPEHQKRCSRNGYAPTADRPFMTITGGRHSKGWLLAAAGVMGVRWMKATREVCEAIPPAYSEFIGRGALNHIHSAAPLMQQPAGLPHAPALPAPIPTAQPYVSPDASLCCAKLAAGAR